jgi:hypothetical protein
MWINLHCKLNSLRKNWGSDGSNDEAVLSASGVKNTEASGGSTTSTFRVETQANNHYNFITMFINVLYTNWKIPFTP